MAEASAVAGDRVPRLVVVGSSAGGVDALSTLVATLPAGFPAPIVVAQHLDPRRRSLLGEILGGRGPLPVRILESQETLRAGVVYVVPADRDVEIDDRTVRLRPPDDGPPKPSVDRLLASAARAFGEELIAVVLSGTGADGASGAQAVKALGGTVVVQNPETAAFSGMPLAVPPSAVDVVAELEAIGPLLADLLGGVYAVPTAGDEAELRALLGLVRDRTGLDFAAYKRPTIARRLERRMAAVGTHGLAEYRRHLERHPEELQRLVAAFLIKVTEFFRDPELFALLRDRVLPELIAEARRRGELRLWSAGCATGEEPYTLAMLVADALGDDLERLPVRIFATDVAANAVEFARRGVYPESALAGLPPELVERHFQRLDGAYEVREAVRGLVVFGEHDLGQRSPFPRIDLVLCRNVLIYFTPELQRRALQLFAFSLRRGGYLALGKAETVGPLPALFAVDDSRLKLFRRVGEAAPLLPPDRRESPTPVALPPARLPRRPPTAAGRRLEAPAPPDAPREPTVGQQAARLLDGLPVGVATVDRDYHIRGINPAGRRLLGVHTGAIGEDLIHRVAPALAGPLRVALDAAFRDERGTAVARVDGDLLDDGGRDLALTCYLAAPEAGGPPAAATVVVEDVSEVMRRQRDADGERERLREELERQTARAARAVVEVGDLRAATQAMAADADALRAENQELAVAGEEAQAATEEIETLNEELQATNEELETLNEELQATVEELSTTNDELQARTEELQTLSLSLEEQRRASDEERGRLDAILAAMADAVLVVDATGQPVLTNAAYDRLFGTDELAPDDEQGRPLPPERHPQRLAAGGEPFTLQFTLLLPGPDPDGGRRWFEATGRPLDRDRGEGAAPGGVVAIRDITDRSLRRLQEEFLSAASHELRTPLTALSGSLQLVARRLGDTADERRRRDLERALQQVRRLEAQIGELMDVARLQDGKLRLRRAPLDLAALVRQAADTAQFLASGQEIRVEAPDGPLPVDGDDRRLEQVLLNLLANAVTYAPGTERIDLRLRRTDGAAEVAVRDYGPGIPAEALPRIFSRFYQVDIGQERTGSDGLGLGLFIARKIVVAHGGTIEADSAPGEGTTFTVRLPVLAEAEAEEGVGGTAKGAAGAADGHAGDSA